MPIKYPLRLNMRRDTVGELHRALSAVDITVDEADRDQGRFGKSTRDAVVAFQRSAGLPQTGEVDGATARALNRRVTARTARESGPTYRVRGTLRDERDRPIGRRTVRVFEKTLTGEQSLGEKTTYDNGFYDIEFAPPMGKRRPKERFHLVVKTFDDAGELVASSPVVFNPRETTWVNFNAGERRYPGASGLDRLLKDLRPGLEDAGLALIDLSETEENRQIAYLATETRRSAQDIMTLLVAAHLAEGSPLPLEAWYAFLGQNLPTSLPGDLLDASANFTQLGPVLMTARDGILAMDPELQRSALEKAVADNVVPSTLADDIDAILATLLELKAARTAEQPFLVGKAPLADVLATTSLDDQQQAGFVALLASHQGTVEEFWTELAESANFDEPAVAEVRQTLELGIITKNHLPFLQHVKGRFEDDGPLNANRDLARLDFDGWLALIEEAQQATGGLAIPDNLDGDNDEERAEVYATVLMDRAEDTYPAVAITARASGALTHHDEIAAFVDAHPDLDLRQVNVDRFVGELEDDVADLFSDSAALGEIKALQRALWLAHKPRHAAALFNAGLSSAGAVASLTQSQFLELATSAGFTTAEAEQTHARADQRYASALAQFGEYNLAFEKGSPSAIIKPPWNPELDLSGAPTLQTLFGSLDFCSCEHCASVLSPAAYLVDILRFLGLKPGEQGDNARAVLFERRPDLGNLKLSCENTNTVMPYIDLVCEILEETVDPTGIAFQSTLTSAELRAHPEYVNAGAYQELKAARFPMTLPFDLWLAEARRYLAHLKIERHELMRTLRAPAGPSPTQIAAEYFELTPVDASLVTTADPGNQALFWGTNNPVADLATVKAFLAQSGLEYDELIELLLVRWVNPAGANATVIQRPADDCDLELQTLTNLDAARLDRMHRFVRLWRATTWQQWELDLLIRAPAVGNGQLDGPALPRLQRFHQLQTRLRVGTEELLAFYQDINTEIRVTPQGDLLPLYHRLFLNRTVTNPTNPALELAQLNAQPAAAIADHEATVLAAVSIVQTDLEQLVPPDGELTLGNLSTIYRSARLARALRMSITDLRRFGDVRGGADPFADLEATWSLVEDLDALRSQRTFVEELAYLLGHQPDSPVAMSDQLVVQRIGAVRAARVAIDNEFATSEDMFANTVQRALQRFDAFHNAAILHTAMRIIDGSWEAAADGDAAIPDADRVAFIDEHFSRFADPAAVAASLGPLAQAPGPLQEQEIAGRFRWILGQLRDDLSANAVTEQVAIMFDLEAGQADALLSQLELSSAPGTRLRVHLLDPALTAVDPATGEFQHPVTFAVFPRVFETMMLAHKVGALVNQLSITPDDLGWLIQNGAGVGGLDFGALPVAAAPSVPFGDWSNLARLLEFKRRFPEPPVGTLFEILDMVASNQPLADVLDALATLTGWNRADLGSVVNRIGLQYPADYTDGATYRRIADGFALLRRAGVAASVLAEWADAGIEPAHAQAIKQAVKSKYSSEQWSEVSTSLQDGIRELKRAALVDYLIANAPDKDPADPSRGKAWTDANGLLAHFLIDVEMTSCFLTSRLKQAISSTQLFVQRCLLNLEADRVVARPNQGWEQWKWVKNAQLWEANRRVFLYPENWIEPELRDDKTPFFEELESQLRQDEINDGNVERALSAYVASLDRVSQLEVMGTFHHLEPGVDDLHVVARSRDLPHVYYRRRFVNNAHWTPWEPIDVEIEAEQVVPCIVDRKLHLFWLEFARKPVPQHRLPPTPAALPTPGASSTRAPEPPEYLEIQLAWTFLDNGAWSGKRLGTRKLIHPWLRPEFSYQLRSRPDSFGRTHIDIHLSGSREFNETQFYDPETATWRLLTDTPYNPNEWPWHSSTFVFDGDVVEVRLNNINGSHTRVSTQFGAIGRQIRSLDWGQKRPRLKQPAELRYEHGRLVNQEGNRSNVNVLVASSQRVDSGRLLRTTNHPFSIVACHHSLQFDSVTRPFFFQDQKRAFFVVPQREWQSGGSFTTVQPSDPSTPYRVRYTFHPFYHPYTKLLGRQLRKAGIDGVLNREIQRAPATIYPGSNSTFEGEYNPFPLARPVSQGEVMDFAYAGAYAQYNWELFFHAPLLIADQLRRNQKFEAAMRWFQFIFDPTNPSPDPVPQRYWVTKPFYEFNSADYQQQRVNNLLEQVNRGSVPHAQQVSDWRNNPFQPHLVARLRPVAYQRAVVMKYIDNLIEWGDQLFRRDSIESINEATQLYMLAAEILGPRPTRVPPAARADDKTFAELLPDLDAFANAMAEIENTVGAPVQVVPPDPNAAPLPPAEAFYFCIPHNDRLLRHWDTVADRLFKIRHCMNIEGVVRQLPLFEPPIDPALLVKAAAAGIDLGSVLSEIDVAMPHYRFPFMIGRAEDFANEVRLLGNAMLDALEKRDAERLAALRAGHEVSVAEAMLEVRQQQIEDAEIAITALQRSRDVVATREEFYRTRQFINVAETIALGLQTASAVGEIPVAVLSLLAGGLGAIPSFSAGISGFGGSPNVTVSFGGSNLAAPVAGSAAAISSALRILDKAAAMTATIGGYQRRADEWAHQRELAERELEQIDVQIEGANIRLEISKQELVAQQRQLDNAEEVDQQMRTKYTNIELYEWMISQLSAVYFQAYQLTYDIAKRAERTFRYDLGIADSSYVKFGYWDSLKKGLLAGEKLSLDLRKLEAAYLERNRRELELTKHVSLAEVAPLALLTLKETGTCVVELPELLFDMDYPGHYFRRLKSVSVTIPSVSGPYSGVHCTLTLLRNSVRTSSLVGDAGYDRTGLEDERFRDQVAAVQSIATSTGLDDSGLFMLDFRDERYLPFEGAGAISRWSIDVPKDANRFDFDTIADVVVHLRYTARQGGEPLAAAARQSVQTALPTAGIRLIDLKREFPDAWHSLLHPPGPVGENLLAVSITPQHFPFFARGRTIDVTRAQLVGRLASDLDYEVASDPLDPAAPLLLAKDGLFGDAHHLDQPAAGAGWSLGDWTFRIRRDGAPDFASLPEDDVEELFLVLHYALS